MQPQLIDNINRTLRDDLMSVIKSGSRVSIAAASFSIYAFQELKEQLSDISELRFIFTSPAFVTEKADKQKREFYIPRLNRERDLYGSEYEIKLRNELSLKAVAKECADWIRRKGCFKSNRTNQNMMGFINVDETNYMPVTGFTTVDLGSEHGNNAYQFVQRTDAPLSQFYLNLFDQLWHDGEKLQDVTADVLDNITNAYKENSPEFIYFFTLYNIFREFLDDISEDVLPNEATGFKSSVIWNKLYNFQRDAALAIINKLEKYNGCILADSVGLGKTFTALSIIKYYENRNKSVLVLCPKKLNDNWITYRSNYLNNPVVADRLRYDVLFHSDLSRRGGVSNGLNLDHINWGNYDLVVIDESHNFRNGGKVTTDENDENPRENRYLQLMNKVIRNGVKTKVLMLSATPVNNRFNDLRNQIALAYEGDSANIDGKLNVQSSIERIFRDAQTAYNRWSRLPQNERTTQALLDTLSFDFFEVLDSVTIARSRKHIEQYYDTSDIGKFPTRLKPISRRPNLTDLGNAINYNEIFQQLQLLNLAIYTPSEFIQPSRMHKYLREDDGTPTSNLTMRGRESGLRKLMSANMLKRLESSVNSFRLTVTRIKEYIEDAIAKVDQLERFGGNSKIDDFDFSQGLDNYDSDNIFIGASRKSQIDLRDMDYLSWKRYLSDDLSTLKLLLLMLADITPAHDSKLQQLIADLRYKFDNPINGDNKKVIIFTAFSDTAEYLYNNLAEKIHEKTGLHCALITGDMEARTTLNLRKKLDFNTILTLFSPVSKERDTLNLGISEDIDVLIATDCISEGQNLQDCDYLINYDIHWNPVRIIQRFGRIDRIGSRNEVIQLVNYWPDMTLDEYINLKGRVEARMKVSVLTATGDDNPLTYEEKGDLEYRREQLKRLQEEVIDLEEMNTGISIMDLGFNEFRLDLLEYMKNGARRTQNGASSNYAETTPVLGKAKENHDVEHTPFGMNAVVKSSPEHPAGTVFVLKNRNNAVNIDRKNRLHPFYFVYITDEGEVEINHLAPKEMLDRLRQLCKGKSEPDADLCHEFNRLTADGKNMKKYSELLGEAITSIITVKEQSAIDSLLEGVQGSLFDTEVKGLDDFELICFLVIK